MSRAPAVRLSGSAQLGAQKLFDGLSFEALPNAWTCLLGPSGVGKSTLLRLIAGLETGAVFDGAVTSSDGQALTGRCAWMAQDDLLLPWLTVAQNIDLGAKLRGAAPDPAARDALIDRFGLGAQRESRPAQLSGGQRQRVALARTLMEDRPVVLLDEPFSALDAKTRAEMQEAAFAALAGRTVILVTHDPA
ncbi:MAG: ABC transporter ATP-binding protein, partial [Mangrovicoccus sp.]